MRIAVAGASGFVGRKLVTRLAGEGHDVTALGRRRAALPDGAGITPVAADVGDAGRLATVFEGVDAAYYLVHSMAGPGFERRDAELAQTFGKAAAAAQVGRIIYLGALGHGELSPHLASRQQVGAALASAGVPTVELRAAVVLGSGSISFEMLRYLVERLPFMICPRWVRTRIEPIAEDDVVEHLVRAIDVPAGVYELGCGETTSYRDLIGVYADVRGLRRRWIIDVPLLTPALSSLWVDLVTPVDRRVSHSLIESLTSEVIVTDGGRTREAFGLPTRGLSDAIATALDAQVGEVSAGLLDATPGLRDGVYTVRAERPVDDAQVAAGRDDLARIGGDVGWYGIAWAWRLRLALGRLVGEPSRTQRPDRLVVGAEVDWWVVDGLADDALVLRSRGWRTGEGWLGFVMRDARITQIAAFRPRGVPGLLYWTLLRPIHAASFYAMIRHRVTRSARAKGMAPPDPVRR